MAGPASPHGVMSYVEGLKRVLVERLHSWQGSGAEQMPENALPEFLGFKLLW